MSSTNGCPIGVSPTLTAVHELSAAELQEVDGGLLPLAVYIGAVGLGILIGIAVSLAS
jgi:lactobin A/cerein 7B family class IIb bacteriocin